MFVDEVLLDLKAGDGGDGCMAFRREKYVEMGGPFGGNGGRGSDIIFEADEGLNTLLDLRLRKHIKGKKGANGEGKGKHGRNSENIIVKVPVGTVVTDTETGFIIADLTKNKEQAVVATGGRGGRGNIAFATRTNPAPSFAENGEPGEEKRVKVELKLLADVGLVGMPSVGKSTFISKVSASKPKIAAYHFTTLRPNLGVVQTKDKRSFVIADLPGLIKGASLGEGLGDKFLRHIERVRLIVHVVDISGIEGRDAYEDYLTINKELESYSLKLASLEQIIVANKCDLLENDEKIKEFEQKVGQKVVRLSAVSNSGTKELLDIISKKLETLPDIEPMEVVKFEENRNDSTSYVITVDEDGVYEVHGGLINMLIRNVVLDDYESFRYFQKTLKERGVIKALRDNGCQEGDTVRISDIEFDFVE